MIMKKILKNKKGFTLMEVIVVLIIIAVLAAALIPSFIGFINQSRAATDISAARVGMTAAQIELTHIVGSGRTLTGDSQILTSPRFIEAVQADTQGAAQFSAFTTDGPGTHITGLLYNGVNYNVRISPTGANYWKTGTTEPTP